jgi:hypothetical protein
MDGWELGDLVQWWRCALALGLEGSNSESLLRGFRNRVPEVHVPRPSITASVTVTTTAQFLVLTLLWT